MTNARPATRPERDCAFEASRSNVEMETCGKDFNVAEYSNPLRLVLPHTAAPRWKSINIREFVGVEERQAKFRDGVLKW